jgi:hypothetical protein
MVKKTKLRPWTKEDVRTLKTMAREKVTPRVSAASLASHSNPQRGASDFLDGVPAVEVVPHS